MSDDSELTLENFVDDSPQDSTKQKKGADMQTQFLMCAEAFKKSLLSKLYPQQFGQKDEDDSSDDVTTYTPIKSQHIPVPSDSSSGSSSELEEISERIISTIASKIEPEILNDSKLPQTSKNKKRKLKKKKHIQKLKEAGLTVPKRLQNLQTCIK
jgi:hypothetical protein